jgi:hypothetical protein
VELTIVSRISVELNEGSNSFMFLKEALKVNLLEDKIVDQSEKEDKKIHQ